MLVTASSRLIAEKTKALETLPVLVLLSILMVIVTLALFHKFIN